MPPVTGTGYLLRVNTGTPAVPTWTAVGAQRDTGVDSSIALIDLSNKEQRAEIVEAGRWTADVTLTHLHVPGAAEQVLLRDANRNGTTVQIQSFEGGVAKETASGIVTRYNAAHPDMGAATVDITIHLTGPWVAVA
jgi:hypothetical protein